MKNLIKSFAFNTKRTRQCKAGNFRMCQCNVGFIRRIRRSNIHRKLHAAVVSLLQILILQQYIFEQFIGKQQRISEHQRVYNKNGSYCTQKYGSILYSIALFSNGLFIYMFWYRLIWLNTIFVVFERVWYKSNTSRKFSIMTMV